MLDSATPVGTGIVDVAAEQVFAERDTHLMSLPGPDQLPAGFGPGNLEHQGGIRTLSRPQTGGGERIFHGGAGRPAGSLESKLTRPDMADLIPEILDRHLEIQAAFRSSR